MNFSSSSTPWKPPLPTSLMWQSRALIVNLPSLDKIQLCKCVWRALRHRVHTEPIALGIIENDRLNTILTGRDGLDTSRCIIPHIGPDIFPSVAVVTHCDPLSLVQIAYSVAVPLLIVSRPHFKGIELQIVYATIRIPTSQACWFLVHTANALCSDCNPRAHDPSSDLFDTPIEHLLFGAESLEKRYNHVVPNLAPGCNRLQDILVEWSKEDPLATAVYMSDGESNSPSDISYAEFLTLAIRLAKEHRSQPSSISIQCNDLACMAVAMVAALFAGAEFNLLGAQSSIGISAPSIQDRHIFDLRSSYPWLDANMDPGLIYDIGGASAILFPVIQSSTQGRLGWASVDHDEALRFLRAKVYEASVEPRSRVLLLSDTLDPVSVLAVWMTLLGGASLCPYTTLQTCLSFSALLATPRFTHFVVSARYIDMFSTEFAKYSASVKGDMESLPNILVDFNESAAFRKLLNTGCKVVSLSDEVAPPKRSLAEEPPTILYLAKGVTLNPQIVMDMIHSGEVIHSIGSTVVKLNDNLLVKRILFARSPTEALNTIYVRDHTTIPVPSIHLVFSHAISTYIVMDYVAGDNLQYTWDTLDDDTKESVMSQLRSYLDQLQALTSSVPGPVDGSRFQGRWFTVYGVGPFESNKELTAWLDRKLAQSKGHESFPDSLPLVFTHQDLSPRNLILSDSGKVWMIDWEFSGFYPPYFEYACTVSDIGIPDVRPPVDWIRRAPSLFPDYSHEHNLLESITWALDKMPFA